MKEFRDKQNRVWVIELTVDSVRRVRDLAEVNLLDVEGGTVFTMLGNDPIKLVDAVCAACRPQLQKAGITDEEFATAMGGDAIEAASNALMQEIVDFFPTARRAILNRILEKGRTLDGLMMERVGAKLDTLDLKSVATTMLGESSTPLPASSVSIPAPSPSDP